MSCISTGLLRFSIFPLNFFYLPLDVKLFIESIIQLGVDNEFGLKSNLIGPVIASLIISCLIFVTIALGTMGSLTSNLRMINFNVFSILICSILQIITMIVIYNITPDTVQELVHTKLIADFDQQTSSVRNAIQILQQNNHCCGVHNYQEYLPIEVQLNDATIKLIPNSCCDQYVEKTNETGKCVSRVELVEATAGCGLKFSNAILKNYHFKSLFIQIGLMLCIQILVIVLFWFVSNKIIQHQHKQKRPQFEMAAFKSSVISVNKVSSQ